MLLKKYFHVIYIASFISFITVYPSVSDANEQNTDAARKLVKLVQEKYTSLDNYYDKGKINFSNITVEFETFFESKGTFFFEWIKPYPVHNKSTRICSSGNKIFVFDDYEKKSDRKKEYQSLRKAFISNLGVSIGSLEVVPSLLLTNIRFTPIVALNNPKIIGDDIIEGENCVHLMVDQYKKGSYFHIWINKKTYLIKKAKSESGNIEIVYLYNTIKTDIQEPDPILKNFRCQYSGDTLHK